MIKPLPTVTVDVSDCRVSVAVTPASVVEKRIVPGMNPPSRLKEFTLTGLPAVNRDRVPVPVPTTVPVGVLITWDEVVELGSEIVIPVESAFAGTLITARPANADKASNLIFISTSGTGIVHETFRDS
jgi:hypothetical protein